MDPSFKSLLVGLVSILHSFSHPTLISFLSSKDLVVLSVVVVTQPSFPSEVVIDIPPAGIGDSTSLKYLLIARQNLI